MTAPTQTPSQYTLTSAICAFLQIPDKVRPVIYNDFLVHKSSPFKTTNSYEKSRLFPAILRTCKVLCDEVLPLPYSKVMVPLHEHAWTKMIKENIGTPTCSNPHGCQHIHIKTADLPLAFDQWVSIWMGLKLASALAILELVLVKEYQNLEKVVLGIKIGPGPILLLLKWS